MAIIGEDCLNCGVKQTSSNTTKYGGKQSLCDNCDDIIQECPKCGEKVTQIIQADFNYFVNCKCGYYGRPKNCTQLGNHPMDYIDVGMYVPGDEEERQKALPELKRRFAEKMQEESK